ncbi:hypothetical protein F442_01178 [Phytophthora nicotianae P10297]|uniref:Uncharacterized protein n=1 Tax=Phytophthora nicotianae P10297 TaxID=1317064 RepID=W3A631_PHYNI|nr:hypothetical protein F442_01178 [Phytophthora nicotianae P10297]
MAPRVALPAPASTPVGMPMTAIPSYGDVTIQVPSTSRNDGGDGAARHELWWNAANVVGSSRSSGAYEHGRPWAW